MGKDLVVCNAMKPPESDVLALLGVGWVCVVSQERAGHEELC